MDFGFAVSGLQGGEITVWDAGALAHLSSVDFHKLRNVLEEFGDRSARAQGLRAAITDIWRLRSSDQRLYLQTAPASNAATRLLGGLKVGKKKLFIHKADGTIAEIEPLCVLDFYVHESCQRQGVGRALFEHMLQAEQLTAEQLAYDRPSPKLLSFLHKHYSLASFVPQSNNFVVFEAYFKQPAGTRKLNRAPSNSSVSSSYQFGNTMLSTYGNGRQHVQVVGSGAAGGLVSAGETQWVPTSLRPPTSSSRRSVHSDPPAAHNNSWHLATGGASLAGGIAGGPAAGIPSSRQQNIYGSLYSTAAGQREAADQQQQVVSYARGAGYRALDRGTASNEPNTFKGFEKALMAPAVNPAPPWAMGGTRDSLDHFSSMYEFSKSNHNRSDADARGTYTGAQGYGSAGDVGDHTCSPAGATDATSSSCYFSHASGSADRYPLAPYGKWEPQVASTLPPGNEADRVSMRRQEEQQRRQWKQQLAQSVAVDTHPPGHLLASPTGGYAVPTEGMAAVLGQTQQQQTNISWNGLPTLGVSKGPEGQQEQQSFCFGNDHPQHLGKPGSFIEADAQQYEHMHVRYQNGSGPGELGSSSGYHSRTGSRGNLFQEGQYPVSARAAAAVFRSGAGAASCLRMM